MIETLSAPVRPVPWSFCRRHQLPQVTPPEQPSKELIRALRALDRNLELYWHPVLNLWFLYRCARRGGVPGDDHLVKEMMLAGPNGEYRSPGHWILDRLRELDVFRGGSVDPKQASRHMQQKIQEELVQADEQRARTAEQIGQDWVSELSKHAYGSTSLHVNRS